MGTRIPFILFGDGPRLATGLARIARDLAMRLVAEQEELGIRFAQVGVDYPGGWHWQPWDFCGFQPNPTDQGRDVLGGVIEELHRECQRTPIVLMIMDPARCYDLTRYAEGVDTRLDARFWGYFPLDANNKNGRIGGPAGQAIWDTDRLLGYGRYGAGLLKRTLEEQTRRTGVNPGCPPVQYLPHGIETRLFHPAVPLSSADPSFADWATQQVPASAIRIGCVATNQPRKDLGLLFSAVAAVKGQKHPIALWLHTDKLTSAWDIGELVTTCGLSKPEVAVSTDELSDLQMAARYAWSHVTIAPGLGEGFGYPIVESLACGTPVLHGDYAGGAELVPQPDWLIPPAAWRLESVYTLLRPVFHPKYVAAAVLQTQADRNVLGGGTVRAYCSGAVAHLDWEYLWPRWRAWIAQGLQKERDRCAAG